MAKKVTFSFSDNPSLGASFNVAIFLSGNPIYYNSGQNEISFEYSATGAPDQPPFFVERQLTLSATLQKTLFFLNTYYYNEAITYEIIGNTIEAIVNLDNITITTSSSIAELTITSDEISNPENLNLKYFFQYTNVVGDSFLCQIFQKRFIGDATEVQGSAFLEKGSVKNHTEPIRGTNLSIELEANINLTFEDLYTVNELDYTVVFKRNNKVIFRGFLKPDGIFQSYRDDYWLISLDCIDGLGTLENLSFVKKSGLRFTGKMKAQDVVYNALNRTGIAMPINVAINLLYDGLENTSSTNILNEIYLNTARFFKEDSQGTGDGTIMSCDEVLKSVLGIFRACITQEDGEWYIYKADEIFNRATTIFKRYDINNVYVGNKNINLNKTIGSQINNFYPHFSDGDQAIRIIGGINAFRLGYKYGFLNGLLANGALKRDGIDFELWTPNFATRSLIIDDPQIPNGLILKTIGLTDTPLLMLSSTPIAVDQGDVFDFKCNLTVTGGQVLFGFKISVGIYFLNNNGEWVTDSNTFYTPIVGDVSGDLDDFFVEKNASFKISTSPVPVSGNLVVEIFQPIFIVFVPGITFKPTAIIRSLDITTNTAELGGKVGEFHTVERTSRISSIVKENDEVIIGDEIDNFFSGSIYKNNQIDTTSLWSRVGTFELYPILRIAAETELRLGQKPLMQFSGSLYGYIPYLTMIAINNLSGKFLPIEYVYDTKNNRVTFKLLEVIADELPDIKYTPTFDYGGNTIKPTIVS